MLNMHSDSDSKTPCAYSFLHARFLTLGLKTAGIGFGFPVIRDGCAAQKLDGWKALSL